MKNNMQNIKNKQHIARLRKKGYDRSTCKAAENIAKGEQGMRKTLTEAQINFLNELPGKYGDMLTKYAYRFFGYRPNMLPLAQDAVQDTYVKAVRHVETLMNHENPAGWMITSLRHNLLTASRNLKNRKEESMADVQDAGAVSVQIMMDALERWEQQYQYSELLDAVCRLLTDEEQITFQDYFLMGTPPSKQHRWKAFQRILCGAASAAYEKN